MAVLCGCAFLNGNTATLTLNWDASPTATSYRLFSSTDTGPFNLIMNVSGTTATVSGVPTNQVTRWYVTALNGAGESPPSNTVTNSPATPPIPPTGIIGISAPTLTTTNLLRGQTITGTARFTNGTATVVSVSEGWLTAREPGASNSSGPFDDWSPGMTAQTVAPGQVVVVAASWVVRADAPFGVWQAHLAVKVDGVYHDGPNTPFNVVAPPTSPPPPPQNLRAVQVGARNIKMQWDVQVIAASEVERSEEQGGFVRIATTSPGVEVYEDRNLRRRRDYRYRVRQVAVGLASDYSNELHFRSR